MQALFTCIFHISALHVLLFLPISAFVPAFCHTVCLSDRQAKTKQSLPKQLPYKRYSEGMAAPLSFSPPPTKMYRSQDSSDILLPAAASAGYIYFFPLFKSLIRKPRLLLCQRHLVLGCIGITGPEAERSAGIFLGLRVHMAV